MRRRRRSGVAEDSLCASCLGIHVAGSSPLPHPLRKGLALPRREVKSASIHCTPPARAGRKQLHGVYYFLIIAFNISLRYAFKFVHSRAQSIDMPASLSMTV